MNKYTQIPETAFQNIQLNAGILVDSFTPADGTIGNLLGATSGGVNFTATPSFTDFGEDIDNAPRNTKELKQLEDWEVIMSGSFVTVTADTAKKLVGLADIDGDDATKIVPRRNIKDSDFEDIWWVGDYSDVTTGDDAGFVAIHLINGLSTGGFSLQSNDRGKGTFDFEFMGHYSIDAQDEVPFEVYVKAGEAETTNTNTNTNTTTTTTP